MDTTTLGSDAIKQTIKAAIPNIRRNSILLIASITSTLFLLGITTLSSNYLSRTNREFATKICLFLTGVSTAVTIRLIDKGINGLSLQAGTLEGGFVMPKQNNQINITNFSGTLINDNVPEDVVLNSGSGSDSPTSEIIVMEPRSFEELPEALRSINKGNSVVLNLTSLDPDVAQKAVDFVAGGAYAVGGHQERIGESIFLFTPQAVQPFVSRSPEQETSLSSSGFSELSSIYTPIISRIKPPSFAQEEETEETQAKTRGEAG